MFSDNLDEDFAIVAYIHDEIIEASGGAKGYHDKKLILSGLARPMQSLMGKDAYVTAYEKAAALLDSIANNHGFRDGNKRTAMAAASYFLDNNDIAVDYSNDEYETFMLHVVNDKPTVGSIAKWLKDHSVTIPATQWSLVDVQSRAKEHPDTFFIPSEQDIRKLKIKSSVKLIFAIDEGDLSSDAERMWVMITNIDGDKFTGTLDNDPAIIRGLKYRDKIDFESKHIASIWED